MIANKLEIQADSDNCADLEERSMATESSSSQDQSSRNRGTELKKQLKKLRSIKLSRLPSSKPSTRRAKSRSDRRPIELFRKAATSEKTSPIKVSDASPNYMKATTTKEYFQASPHNSESSFDSNVSYSSRPNSVPPWHKSTRSLTRTSSLKPARTLTRMSSLKSKRPLIKKKLNKSRSIKLANFERLRQSTRLSKPQFDQPSIDLSSNASTKHNPNYLKATSCSDLRKAHFQESPHNSEFSFNGKDQRRKNSNHSKPSSASPRLKSARTLTRKTTMKPVRILKKMATLKSKRPPVRKCSKVSRTPDLSVNRATCSSTLKNSKFPEYVELEPGGSDSKGLSVIKVCPYTYCSHNGHCHAPMPPLKQFLSIRRRLLKTQRSIKLKSVSPLGAKHSGDVKKGIQENQMVSTGNTAIPERASAGTAISPLIGESGMDFFIEIYAKQRAELLGGGTHGGDDEAINDFESLAEILLGETSYPQIDFRENLHQISDFLTGEQNILVTFPPVKETSLECCCIKSELDKPASEATDTNWKEESVASNLHNSIPTEDQSDLTSVTGEPSDTSKSTTPDAFVESIAINSAVSSASVRDPLEGLTAASEEKNEDSEPDYRFLQGLPPLGDSETYCTPDVANETQLEKQKNIRMWRLIYQSVVPGIAAKVGTQLHLDGADEEEQVGDANTLLRKNISGSCQGFSETDQDMGMENHDAGRQNIKLSQIDAIKLVEEAIDEILLPEVQDHSSDDKSITSDINSDQDLLERNHGEGGEQSISTSTDSTKDSFREFDKIKVKNGATSDPDETWLKADNITTPEQEKTVPKVGSKSSQQMPKSWSNLKKLILLKRFIKALEKVRTLNPREPRYLPLEPDAEAEKIYLRNQMMDERKSAEEWMLDYALRQVVAKLTPARKRKVGLLAEAFETVIPLSEIETHLRHNASVSTHTNPVRACIGSSIHSGDKTGKENDCGNLAEVMLGETSHPETTLVISPELKETSPECCCIKTEPDKPVVQASDTDWKEEEIVASNLDNGEDNSILTDDQPDLVNFCLPELEVPRLCEKLSLKPDDIVSTYHEEVPAVGKVFQEVHEEIILSIKPDFCHGDSESKGENLETDDLTCGTGQPSARIKSPNPDDFEESTATNSVVSSASVDPFKDLTAASEENNRDSEPDYESLQRFPSPEDSVPNCNTHTAYKTQLDKQKNIKMWRMIYQHVVLGSAAKVGSQLHLDGADEEEQVDDANTLHGSCQDFSETDKDMGMENHNALSQIDAIKLVEEAIDEILLPEIQDHSSDDQSITSDVISDQDLLEKNHDEGGELSISTSIDSTEDSFREFDKIKVENRIISDPEETWLKVDNVATREHEKTLPKEGRKSNQQMPKSWSNLKKLILLKRFIKALEKVRKYNPRKPQYLPLGPDPEAEKIDLRHQTAEERKSAEEWMLDYALQHVVAKLTPARKRRVELLVEAFETVIPLSEIETHLKHHAAVSTHAKPIQACD